MAVVAAFGLLSLLAGCRDAPSPDASTPPPPPPRSSATLTQSNSPNGAAANPDRARRFGDAGLTRVRDENDRHYPILDDWAIAGVQGGIPEMNRGGETHGIKAASFVQPAQDIQAAINAASSGDVVVLAEGEHVLLTPLQLKSGVILRGAKDGAVIRFGDTTQTVAVVMRQVRNAGVENVRVVYAAPGDRAQQQSMPATRVANAPGFNEVAEGALHLENSTNCWLSDVRVELAWSHPLTVRNSAHCTIRGFRADAGLNRGNGAGSLILDGNEHLLLVGLQLRGLRSIYVSGPASGSVLRSMVSGCGVYFHQADAIRGWLFEDCHFLFRPGHPFEPFNKGPMPMGADCLVVNCTVYHHGTDAVSGQILQPRKPYVIHRYATRDNALPGDEKPAGFISPYRYVKELERSRSADSVLDIPATWNSPPAGARMVALRHAVPIDDWAWTTSVGQKVMEQPMAELLAQPLIAGTSRQFAGVTVDVAWTGPEQRLSFADGMDPAHLQQMMGRFGWQGLPLHGGKVELLERVKNDWAGGLVMQRIMHIPGTPVVAMHERLIGCRARFFMGETELVTDRKYRLQPGCHALTALVALQRKTSLIQSASVEVKFDLQAEPTAPRRILDVPQPARGWIYPFDAGIDELGDERAALAAWPDYFNRVLRQVPASNRIAATKALIEAHPDTHVAWVAERIHQVLVEAPHDEDARLTESQWGELGDYYHQQGLPERKWGINKKHHPGTYREYYPDQAATVVSAKLSKTPPPESATKTRSQ